jgi:cyanophycin synthetase
MEENEAIDLSKIKFTTRLVIERALARGWNVTNFKSNRAILLIGIPGRKDPIKVFSASPPQMSYPAAKIAKDKFITNRILSMYDLPVPEEILIDAKVDYTEDLPAFLKKNKTVVIKPLDASHGKGITMNVDAVEKLEGAIAIAKEASARGLLLAQQQVEGIDIRVVCINYKAVDAISRIPASVEGDGQHTVEELIAITNDSDERGENYKARLNVIPLDKVIAYLGADKVKEVPGQGETVRVIGVSNIGMGGIRSNIWKDVPDFLKEQAETAARALELPVCGVDFMVKHLPQRDDAQDTLAPYIIEVNECPMLTMYDDLYSLEQSQVIDTYLDFLAEY